MAKNHLELRLEDRLIEWASWFGKFHSHGMGYPSVSLIYRLIHEGHITRSTGPRPCESNQAAEEIEKMIVDLSEFKPPLGRAIKDRYLCTKETPIASLARQNGVSVRAFELRVKEGKAWLIGRLWSKDDFLHAA